MSLAFTISIALMIAVPLLLAIALRRRFRAPWILWTAGAVAFFLSQVYHLPLNNWLGDIGLIGPIGGDAPNLLRTSLVLGLSAALCEGLMRLVAFWWLNRRGLVGRWSGAVMVGLGHGGLEAMILAATTALSVSMLFSLRGTDLTTLDLTAEQLAMVQQQLAMLDGSLLLALLPFVERLAAITIHVTASLLVWLAFRRRQPLFVLAAILYHALVDATAVYVGQFITNPWLMEGVVVLMAVPGLLFALWSYRRWGVAEPRHAPPALRLEWRAYLALLRKELLEQWRTKKVLVILVVFLLFGLTAPLMARFVTEIIMSVPGAEQFAGLIPEPKAADAVAQFIESITQFGFILILLLTMGLIAGEKERGTAALVLSKPVPRWAFVLSKFDALALVTLPAVLLAGLGAGYYTNLLFSPGLNLGLFLLGNVVLWLWLMAIAAVVLLGSALGRTTLIGAGLGLLFAAVLLVAGAFPQAAALLPGGLVAWAAQLGVPEPAATNGVGALVGTVVVIAFCLVTAVGVVERQEV